MSKRRLYIETRDIILFAVNTAITFTLLLCIVLERMDVHIPASMFPILAIAGILEGVAAWQWVMRPYFKSKRSLALFASGYSFEGLFDEAYPISAEMEKAQGRLTALLKSTQLLSVSKRQAQFIALQNQINPHFLYNTLEGIRSEALRAGLSSVASIAEALSTFFRYTISQMETLVTLGMEIENTRGYVLIQQYRFGERLQLAVQFDGCESAATECKLPKLTLQPIVENAIVHGLEGRTGEGHLTIKIKVTASRLIITVSDDGVGMDEAALHKMQDALAKRTIDNSTEDSAETNRALQGIARGGIALRNVNNRIKILFGEEYGLSIESTKGAGTDVRVLLPLVTDAAGTEGKKDGRRQAEHRIDSHSKIIPAAPREVLRMVDVVSSPQLNGLTLEVLEGEVCGIVSTDHIGLTRLVDILLADNNSPLLNRGSVSITGCQREGESVPGEGVIIISGGTSRGLLDSMTITENLFIICASGAELINRKALRRRAMALMEHFGLSLDPDMKVSSLTAYQKTILSLAKAWDCHAALVVLVNITSSLTMDDTERVMVIVRELSVEGLSFIYICNHHQEAFRYCNNLIIMERGKVIKRLDRKDMNALIAEGEEAAEMASVFRTASSWVQGRALRDGQIDAGDNLRAKDTVSDGGYLQAAHKEAAHGGDSDKSIVLEVRFGMIRPSGVLSNFGNLQFSVHKGETVVVLDNDGVVLHSLAESLAAGKDEDSVFIYGKHFRMQGRQLAIIPAEPTVNALFPDMPLLDNLCFTIDNKIPRFYLTKAARKAVASDVCTIFGAQTNARTLYGMDDDTLYKIVYQRILIQHPAALIAVQPLSSATLSTRLMLLDYFDAFRAQGIATCILSYAASDLLAIADRLLVIGEGASISREYKRSEFDEFHGLAGLRPM